ncbi:MAG: hypothetical protein BGN96_10460 [Bacteroidales bacterium 45-6]|nr:MAG: hypothetical protein BGN96_10460 [Bacteroidales bacterium 45-6]
MKKSLFLPILMYFILIITSCNRETFDNATPPKDSTSYKVSIYDATKELNNVLNITNTSLKSSADKRKIADCKVIKNTRLKSTADTTDVEGVLIYGFNLQDDNGNNAGFALLPSDRRYPPILAITDSGSLTDSIDNPGVKIFIQKTQNLIAKLTDSIKNAEKSITKATVSTASWSWPWENVSSIRLGVITNWRQGSPYNYYVPGPYAGCVPVAVGQVMAFHKYPLSYSGYSFNWAEMLSIPTSYSINDLGSNNIAKLMYYLGTSNNLNASYMIDGTGANTDNIQRTFKNFGYTNTGSNSSYNTTQVQFSIESSKPVISYGYALKDVTNNFLGLITTTKYSGGHAWVIDGILIRRRLVGRASQQNYEYETLVHCNWGWGGQADGFYSSSSFDTNVGPITKSGTDYYYQYKIGAITGITK